MNMTKYLSILLLSAATLLPVKNSMAASAAIGVEHISFAKQDGQATQLMREMYGKKYSYIKAVRLRLNAPSDDPDAIFAKIGNGPNCEKECQNIALFYNTKWLEIYRRPATDKLSLTAVKALGMKSILEDGREWQWNSQTYVPTPDQTLLKPRKPTEDELIRINEMLGSDVNDTKGFGPPEVTAYDTNFRVGGEKIFTVVSPYFCGQGPCPVYVMDSGGVMIGNFSSNDGAVGLSQNVRDSHDYRALELMGRDGLQLISIRKGSVLKTIKPQSVTVAGEVQ